jgi:hypothetical protein
MANVYDTYRNMVLGGFRGNATSNPGSTNAITTNQMNKFSALGKQNRFSALPKRLMTSNQAYKIPQSPRQPGISIANNRAPIVQGNARQDTATPNLKNNLLNFVSSPYGKGMAQGLLEASGYSEMPTSLGQALALGMQRGNEAEDRALTKENAEFTKLLKEKEMAIAENKEEREGIVFDKALLKDENVKEIFSSINPDDFENDKEYYSEVAKNLIKEGYYDEASKFATLGKPTTVQDFSKQIISANKDEKATYQAVQKGVSNFRQILDAANQEGGASSYALMIKFIKQLDDSVVREGEVRSFQAFQGLYKDLKIRLEKFKGQGFPPDIKTEIVNLANKTVNRLVTDYDAYKTDRSENLYAPLNIPPSMVFAGYEINTEGLDLGGEYTEDDFSQDNLKFRKNLRLLDVTELGSVDTTGYSEDQKIFFDNLLDKKIKELEKQ